MMKIYQYNEVSLSDLLIRTVEKSGVSESVRAILADVEAGGTRRFSSIPAGSTERS